MRLDSVLISDAVDQACVQLLRDNGIRVTLKTKMPLPELLEEIKKHDGLIVRSDTKVTRQVLDNAPKLKVIGRAGTGVDNIDLEAATARGILVMNTPGGNSISACELTCALISSLARHVSPASSALKKGSWERKNYAGTELYGKTLAVLGLGRIGREVAVRMQAFGMKTIGYDPIISAQAAREFNVEKMELEQIWPLADYITVHTPLIPQTRNLINFEVLNKCKKGVYIINVARGGIVDEEGLLRSLESGQCGGAALDVFTEEPPKSEGLIRLLEHPRVLATPHLGASTAEAQQRVAVEIAEQFVALTKGEALFGVVNCPALTTAVQASTKPWVDLAKALGSFGPSSDCTVTVQTFGPGLERLSGHLGPAVLAGMLASQTANLINAPTLAKEANLTVRSEHLHGEQQQGLQVNFSNGRCVRGSVVEGVPSLLAVDDARFGDKGVELGGNLLMLDGVTDLAQVVHSVAAKGVRISRLATAHAGRGCVAVHTDARVDGAVAGGRLLGQLTF
ncbi:D-3-phosphoglycerate dehydrogenase [Neocloeon triangulifer]|uniref:D-3-phosphoglycerate dehydrogenase n=1 Tax=Neocloeon triangulifer TaxID=2078957 RepID=UPI00286F6ED1|nr:D-3-phosphoglycerate dehydrogenase [Neocloeon triangulifer]